MDVYYKRCQTWQKWPNNDLLDTDIVYFSSTYRDFEKNIIIGCSPTVLVPDRKILVAKALGLNVKKISLIKA